VNKQQPTLAEQDAYRRKISAPVWRADLYHLTGMGDIIHGNENN
jgi:hypothetical protein